MTSEQSRVIKEMVIRGLEGTRLTPNRINECREFLDTDLGHGMILVALKDAVELTSSK